MKRVSTGVDSISVSGLLSSLLLLLSSTHLFYLLLLVSLPVSGAEREASPLESALLNKLGLTLPPTSTTQGPVLPVPEHFINIYNQVEQGMIDEELIRLVYPQELVDLNAGLLLSYNLSLEAQQARKERVVSAQLKLRVTGGKGAVKVYRVEDTNRLRVERLLDSVEITGGKGEEEIIDLEVTEGVPYRSQKQLIRLLVVFPPDSTLAESPSHSLTALPLARAASATMVVKYIEKETKEGEEELEEESEHPKRRKRSASEEERRRAERKERRRKNRKHRIGGDRGICQRKPMYVHFADLQWNDWILAPVGYEAYQCSGSCPYPFPANANSTNHAIIQGLLHNYNNEIPEPCCVPTETEGLTILFREVSSRIVIKTYPDMIVTACGCR